MEAGFEATILAWAGLLAAAQLLLMSVPANLQMGSEWLASARDDAPPRELSGVPARLKRAFDNMIEGLVMFAVAVAAVALTGASSAVTEGAAAVYLAARLVYVPLYAFGVPWVRSAVWAVGFFATVVMLVAAAF